MSRSAADRSVSTDARRITRRWSMIDAERDRAGGRHHPGDGEPDDELHERHAASRAHHRRVTITGWRYWYDFTTYEPVGQSIVTRTS